jgi:hypothetical protein
LNPEIRHVLGKPTPCVLVEGRNEARRKAERVETRAGSKSRACLHRDPPRNLGDLMISTLKRRKGATA